MTFNFAEIGELEITSVNNEYLKKGKLKVEAMNRGIAWLDTGTTHNMLKAASFIQEVQDMQGLYIASLEEIAWRRGFIDDKKLKELGNSLVQTDYGKYLLSLLDRRD